MSKPAPMTTERTAMPDPFFQIAFRDCPHDRKTVLSLVCFLALTLPVRSAWSQQTADTNPSTSGSVDSADGESVRTIIIGTSEQPPEPEVFYTAKTRSEVHVTRDSVDQDIQLTISVVQGKAETVSLGLAGEGDVIRVDSEAVDSWSVRRKGAQRYLDLHLREEALREQTKFEAKVSTRHVVPNLPASVNLMHLTPGKALGFDSFLNLRGEEGIEVSVDSVDGFAPIASDRGTAGAPTNAMRFQTTTGGQLEIKINRTGTARRAVELFDTKLTGKRHANGDSIDFQLQTTAVVREPGAEWVVLSGEVAVSRMPKDSKYRLQLVTEDDQQIYELAFDEPGTYDVQLDFVARVTSLNASEKKIDFSVASSAIVPIELTGMAADLQFASDRNSVVPLRRNDAWVGFLPASGRVSMQWRDARKKAEGKLFFTTNGLIEAKVGTGLLRQDHRIQYQVLQGTLRSLSLRLLGPGEILDVQGNHLVGWKVSGNEERRLEITLSQPITSESQFTIRSQTPLGDFPVRVEGLRLEPVNALRHSGYLRLTNSELVRLEPTELSGLSQLSPNQFPDASSSGESTEARQTFVYRFPAKDHSFTVAADRIQPEINVSQLVVYQVAETDRVIRADLEIDIREAPIRQWDVLVPADYSVVSVTGASVSDYVAATEVADGKRNLKVIFRDDVSGRQLVMLHLEKNQAAAAGDWVLPRLEFPGAKTVRGDIGIMGAPGFRIGVDRTDLLAEKPLSYFPKPSPNLQQAFRIRQQGWFAAMRIELLDRSVQSDVFHLYSLSERTAFGSALVNYFVAGAPVSEWKLNVPQSLENVMVDGQDVRTWRRDGDTLIVSLQQPVMGAYTLLLTFEEKPEAGKSTFRPGVIEPVDVQGERGYVQVVSPRQVEIETVTISPDMLKLDALELPAEFRLLSTAPPLGTWQYTERPFELQLKVNWFEPGNMVTQVVEFSEANSRVSRDGEWVTDVLYFVKSRGQSTLKLQLPDDPVRLWEVSVAGQPVTARQARDATLIPLPGGSDPNEPIEVRLRLGKPAVKPSAPQLSLPTVGAPVLKTQWNVVGDEEYVLVPGQGTVRPPVPVLRPTGFAWVTHRGLLSLILIGLLTALGVYSCGRSKLLHTFGLACLLIAVVGAFVTAGQALLQRDRPEPLRLSLPVMSAGERIELQVRNTPLWLVNLSWPGVLAALAGAAAISWARWVKGATKTKLLVWGGNVLIALGILLQRDGAAWFFASLGIAVLVFLVIDPAIAAARWLKSRLRALNKSRASKNSTEDPVSTDGLGSVTSVLVLSLSLLLTGDACLAGDFDGFRTADSIEQNWQVTNQDSRLIADGSVTFSGVPGDQFRLLRAPAVLTKFEGDFLRLTKRELPGKGMTYVVSILAPSDQPTSDGGDKVDPQALDDEQALEDGQAREDEQSEDEDNAADESTFRAYSATFQYQVESLKPTDGIAVLTDTAAVQRIEFVYDEPGWEVVSPTAVRVVSKQDSKTSQASVLLGPGASSILLKPKTRDVASEDTLFFVEAENLYQPSPGALDGRHRLSLRVSQGELRELKIQVPSGLTVSSVEGPVGSWQFDAETGRLTLGMEPAQSSTFKCLIETQRGLDPLPTELRVSPLRVEDASGQVGLVGVAFGPEAQPEKLTPQNMSPVNLGDFDKTLIRRPQAVLQSVYRYGAEGGDLAIKAAAVEPEVRVLSKQVLSLGDERIVLGINLEADISRAGLFQLSFPLPDGLEVESLTGDSLHHWSELSGDDNRQIVLHLNGKTIGKQSFALTLVGPTPQQLDQWSLPRFELNEAARQTGDLIVKPTTGIRLRAMSRKNLSEMDPRSMGGKAQGALAFRLLQRDWELVLGVEKLDAWVTGQVLHEIVVREGQTRSTLHAILNVQNASLRSLPVVLPISDEDQIKTLRATGDAVSDFVRTAADSDVWELQLKRRVVGKLSFQIEYEWRGDRDTELLRPAEFPSARQTAYYFAVRAGGRLELSHDPLGQGWQKVDWSIIPQTLREAGSRSAPTFALRAVTPSEPMSIQAQRHSLADALKLRVASGSLTTVISPTGDQLTAVDATIEVIQRSSLSVGLPPGGELFSIFVNGESVNSIRLGQDARRWQFTILPGMDDRTAKVRFVYSVTGASIHDLHLASPELNVPLENIEWKVIAPQGFELTDDAGNLELIQRTSESDYDRESYLSKVSGKRKKQAQQAAQLLQQANELLQVGEQTKARRALNSVANQYALDAASNEDARVQLENLQRQQAVVGLNTRRQRLYLDNRPGEAVAPGDKQVQDAAAVNPILQQDQLNFRPQQLSQLLQGNSSEDNAVLQQIAVRLVQHQRTAELAPQAIIISLPEEGTVYKFSRSVQVAENAPLQLDLSFDRVTRLRWWPSIVLLMCLAGLALAFSQSIARRRLFAA